MAAIAAMKPQIKSDGPQTQDHAPAIGVIVNEIRQTFVEPSLFADSFADYWRSHIKQCYPKILDLDRVIRSADEIMVEIICQYAREIVDILVPSHEWLSSSGVGREVDVASWVFRDAISLSRTNKALSENKQTVGESGPDLRPISIGVSKVLLALLSIDSHSFMERSSPQLAWDVFQLLRDGAWGMYHHAAQNFYLQIDEDVLHFAKQKRLLSYIETMVLVARESFRLIKLTGISLASDAESGEQHITVDAVIPLPVDETMESYQQFSLAWSQAVPWPQRDSIIFSYVSEQ